ncbi:MAG: ABC transporter permease subunit [Planctomycetes bacterium]|nr:ABC transporter permease subunit [Planctomycetota bacterium]
MKTGAVRHGFEDVRPLQAVPQLWKLRPRSRLVRFTLAALALLVVYAWCAGDIGFDEMFTARRAQNFERFVGTEIQPFELRAEPFSLMRHVEWAWDLGVARGFEGALATLAMSILAMTLAASAASLLLLFAARNVATRDPFQSLETAGARGLSWRLVTATTRAVLIFLRAIPEYIWAYVFLALFGPSAWPAILALALHNAGILGKLGAETVENLEPRSLSALRQLGATRAKIVVAGLFPLSLSRYLLYVFYRFETCVREATVLGMLGIVSLGYWIQESRSRQFYDQMVFFVLLGAVIVFAADLFSTFVRARLRRA